MDPQDYGRAIQELNRHSRKIVQVPRSKVVVVRVAGFRVRHLATRRAR
jgi:hypothetical protein